MKVDYEINNLLESFSEVANLRIISYMYGHTCSKSMDRPGKVANSARGQLNKENEYSPVRVCA